MASPQGQVIIEDEEKYGGVNLEEQKFKMMHKQPQKDAMNFKGISVEEYNMLKGQQQEKQQNQIKQEKLQKSSNTIMRIKDYINANGKGK